MWKEFFHEFLNIKGLEKEHLPSIPAWRSKFQQVFFERKMAKQLDDARIDVAKGMMT